MTVDLKDLRTKMGKRAEAQSTLHLGRRSGARCGGRDEAGVYERAESRSWRRRRGLKHFAKPEWQAAVKGTLELKQISVLADVDGLNAGRWTWM